MPHPYRFPYRGGEWMERCHFWFDVVHGNFRFPTDAAQKVIPCDPGWLISRCVCEDSTDRTPSPVQSQ